ncbi:hypothetical protein CYMTET_12619, partial [Cymbomonas tetramitiformis]
MVDYVGASQLIKEVAATVFARDNEVNSETIRVVWENVCRFITVSLKAGKGVSLPGVGVFRISHRLHASCVYPSESLLPTFKAHERFDSDTKKLEKGLSTGRSPVVPLNYEWIAGALGIKHILCKRIVRELMARIAKHMAAGRSLWIEFTGLGRMKRSQRSRTIEFSFDSDLLWPPVEMLDEDVQQSRHLPPGRSGFMPDSGGPATDEQWGGVASPRVLQREGPSPPHRRSSKMRSMDQAFVPHNAGGLPSPVKQQKVPALDAASTGRVPRGIARCWDLCLRSDKVQFGWLPRILVERFIRKNCANLLKGIGAGQMLDVLERHTHGKMREFVCYQALLNEFLDLAMTLGLTGQDDDVAPLHAAGRPTDRDHFEQDEEEDYDVCRSEEVGGQGFPRGGHQKMSGQQRYGTKTKPRRLEVDAPDEEENGSLDAQLYGQEDNFDDDGYDHGSYPFVTGCAGGNRTSLVGSGCIVAEVAEGPVPNYRTTEPEGGLRWERDHTHGVVASMPGVGLHA